MEELLRQYEFKKKSVCLKVYLNEMIIVLLDPRCRNKLGVGHEASLQSFLKGRRCSGA